MKKISLILFFRVWYPPSLTTIPNACREAEILRTSSRQHHGGLPAETDFKLSILKIFSGYPQVWTNMLATFPLSVPLTAHK
jgi:hypothetical protein